VPTDRAAGYHDALAAAAIEIRPELAVAGGFTIDHGRAGMDRLLATSAPPTAVFAISDEMAIGAMQSARRHGLRIPEDLSLVGFDDHEVAGAIGLTTVRQPVAELGAIAARLLLEGLEGAEAEEVVVTTRLVVRATTARLSP
jgi:DNA-binding LacI/PurR family transcriptional regulator